MMKRTFASLLLCASLLGHAAPASATEILFDGSMSGTAVGALEPACAPLLRTSTLTGTGTSSLGNFGYSHTVCLSGVSPVIGNFLFDFSGGNTLLGSINGNATATLTPSLFDIALNYTILGGTGLYADATGAFTGIGTVDQRVRPTTSVAIVFSAVPEPASWAMMLIGFGAIGATMRFRRRQSGSVASPQFA